MIGPDTWLVEFTGRARNGGAAVPFYFSSGPGSGFKTRPTDNPASQFYDGKIKQAGAITRAIFEGAATSGASRIGFGEFVLLNGDSALDYLIDYGFDGQVFRVLKSETADPTYADFQQYLIGTMEQPEFQADVIRIKLRDNQYQLAGALQVTKYSGAGLGTLEGVAGDLKGKPKPVCYGQVSNIAPPCVETAKLIYQVNDGTVNSVDAVYVRGVSLTNGGTYATQADLLDNTLAPAAGAYKAYLAGGCFRLGSTPDGLVTADVTQGATAADRTAAQIFRLVLERAVLTNPNSVSYGSKQVIADSGESWATDDGVLIVAVESLSNDDVVALDAANSSVIGYWSDTIETTIAAACDEIAGTVGAWWGVDRFGAFRIKRFAVPTTQPVLSFKRTDLLLPPARLATTDLDRGLPVYRSTVRWGKNYTVQTSDVAASVTNARRSFLEQEFREAKADNLTVQAIHLMAPAVAEDSLLTTETDTQTEATRRNALRSKDRDRFALVAPYTNENAVADLGDAIDLIDSRYGRYDDGFTDDGVTTRRRYLAIGIESNAADKHLNINVWGPTYQVNAAADSGELWVTDDGSYVVTGPE